MIRAVLTTKNGVKTLLLGLDKEDVKTLTSRRLIPLKPEDDLECGVCLMYGETIADLLDAMRKAGLDVPDVLEPGKVYEREQSE